MWETRVIQREVKVGMKKKRVKTNPKNPGLKAPAYGSE